MGKRAITGQSFFDLEDALLHEIRSARRRDPYSSIHVLVGSNMLGAHLRRRFAWDLGGLFNVHFQTFIDLVSIIEGACRPLPKRQLTELDEKVIVGGILSRGDLPGCFGEAAGMRGFGDALLETFSDLAEGGCTPAIARSIIEGNAASSKLNERVIGVLSMYARFREMLSGCGEDTHTRFMNVIGSAETVPLDGPLLVYGFYDFNEMQWRLIESIAGAVGVTMFVPWSEGEPFGFAGKLLEQLERAGFVLTGIPSKYKKDVRRPETLLMSAPDEEEEARGVVRRILCLVRDGEMRFGDIGIVLPSPGTYWPLLREALEEAGIPYFVRGSGMPHAVGPAAVGAIRLLELLWGRMERSDIVEFLVSAPLSLPGDRGSDFDPFSLWVGKSAETGLIGEGGWVEENRRLLGRIERAGDSGEDTERILDSVRFVGCVLERIYETIAEIRGEAAWADLARSFSALIRDLFVQSEDTDYLCRLVEGLSGLDRVSPPVTFDAFSRIAEHVIRNSTVPGGHFKGDGVNVLTLNQARGISFKALFLVGLTESALPGVARQDPFLKDGERVELSGITGGEVSLSGKVERIDEEALIFRLELEAAENEIVCSYPRFEAGTGKQKIPSSFLRFIEGYSMDTENDDTVKRLWLSRRVGDDFEPLGGDEYDRILAGKYREGSGGSLPVNPFLSRGMELVRSRWGNRYFTPFDGVFSSREALNEIGLLLEERGWSFSPTSMESYAVCPFAYFLGNVLGAATRDEPQRTITITPLQRGRLVHSILAGLFTELESRELLPVTAASKDVVFEIAADFTARFLKDYPGREPVGLPVFWEMEKRNISDSIRILLEEELSDEDDYVPSYFERPFGGNRSRVSFDCGGRTIFFHGRVDRIDLSEGGGFRVIDYKTGALKGDDQSMDGGTCLQLPVYLLAASKILARPIDAGTAEYRRVGTRGGKRRLYFTGGTWDEDGGELERVLDVITSGIQRGLFFAPASGDACEYCELRPACPSGGIRLFEMKAEGDERCRDYLEMRLEGRGKK